MRDADPHFFGYLSNTSVAGKVVSEASRRMSMANPVNMPNQIVGLKFENMRMMKPANTIDVAMRMARPIVACDRRTASGMSPPVAASSSLKRTVYWMAASMPMPIATDAMTTV